MTSTDKQSTDRSVIDHQFDAPTDLQSVFANYLLLQFQSISIVASPVEKDSH